MHNYTLPRNLTDDKILKQLARIFDAMVKEHGVETALGALTDESYYTLYMYFLEIQRTKPDPLV